MSPERSGVLKLRYSTLSLSLSLSLSLNLLHLNTLHVNLHPVSNIVQIIFSFFCLFGFVDVCYNFARLYVNFVDNLERPFSTCILLQYSISGGQ